ncbi:hypothetical protein BV20DRAFT_979442 [Pilatotrama ljubarskyi]|nr:hypothetical protein BV20DRAFT_979442 [Pilatotrama ljubarskyi]
MDALSMHEDVDYELPYVERDAIKRPPNAFMLYRRVKSKELKTQPGESGGKAMPEAALSKIIGVMWRQESAEVQGRYYALAEEAKLEHMEKHPEWKFKTRTKKGKAKAAAERTRKAHSPPRATHADPFTGFSPAYLPPGQFFLPSMSSSAASTPPLSWSPYPQGSSGPITPSSGLMESEHAPFNMVELEQRASQDSLEIPARTPDSPLATPSSNRFSPLGGTRWGWL